YSRRDYFAKADMKRYVTQPMRIDDEDDVAASPGRSAGTAVVTVETMLHEAQATLMSGEQAGAADGKAPDAKAPDAARRRASDAGPAAAAAAGQLAVDEDEDAVPAAGGAWAGTTAERLSAQLSFASRWLIRDLFSQARWRGWRNNTLRGVIYLHLIVTQAFSRILGMFSEYTFSLSQLWSDGGPDGGYRGAIGHVLGLVNALLLLDRYNQWAWVQFMFYVFPLVNALAGAAIDRTLVKVALFLVSEQQLAMYIDALASSLWKPENGGRFQTGSRPYRTLEQQRVLKADVEDLVAELLPYVATRFFYGQSEQERLLAARRILEPFENRQLNKHLVYIVLDALVGKIAPELQAASDQPQPQQQQPMGPMPQMQFP
ncbi:hypothetical protein IWQ57_002056, partial [Coemansia nantahalensis]